VVREKGGVVITCPRGDVGKWWCVYRERERGGEKKGKQFRRTVYLGQRKLRKSRKGRRNVAFAGLYPTICSGERR
jgi:hypothetical protein